MSLLVAYWRFSPLYEQCITLVSYDISSRGVLAVWAGGNSFMRCPPSTQFYLCYCSVVGIHESRLQGHGQRSQTLALVSWAIGIGGGPRALVTSLSILCSSAEI